MDDSTIQLSEETLLTNRRKCIRVLVLLFTLLITATAGSTAAQPQAGLCNCGGALTLGGVGYGDGWDLALTRLIAYFNGIRDFPRIREQPVLLSYENGIAFAKDDQLDVALLTPLVFTKARLEQKNLVPVALTYMEGDSSTPRFQYQGIIYINKDVDPKTLRKPGDVKASIALIPNSSSGYLYPLNTIVERLAKTGVDIEPTWESVSNYFNVRISSSHSDSLRAFFTDKDPVDIIAVYDQEPRLFLRKPDRIDYGNDPAEESKFRKADADHQSNLHLVQSWFGRNRCRQRFAVQTVDEVTLPVVLASCKWDQTAEIPGDVIAVNSSQNSSGLADRVRQALDELDVILRGGAPVPAVLEPLKRALKRRGIVGFETDLPRLDRRDAPRIETAYEAVKQFYTNHKRLEQTFGTDAESIVRNIAYDMRWRLSQGDPARLAVVLSGGGASGAYQAGALIELQKAIAKFKAGEVAAFNDTFQPRDLRVHLFVGTSVGAINAVAAALSQAKAIIGRDQGSPEELRDLWLGKTVPDKPAEGDGINSGILRGTGANSDYVFWVYWLYQLINKGWGYALIGAALVQIYVFFKICNLLAMPISKLDNTSRMVILVAVLATALVVVLRNPSLGIVMLHLLAMAGIVISTRLSRTKKITPILVICAVAVLHVVYETWPSVRAALTTGRWLQFDLWLGAFLLTVSFIAIAQYYIRTAAITQGFRNWLDIPFVQNVWRGLQLTVQALVFVIAPVFVIHLLAQHRSFFDAQPLEASLVRQYQSLLGRPGSSPSNGDARTLSREIFRTLEESNTDLVITATDFTNYREGVQPREIYFYRSERDLKDVRELSDRCAKRWVNLRNEAHKGKIIDMVMASAAVFPGFPPREIDELKVESVSGPDESPRQYKLIDGGFLHNVPVQAAVELGATHIIIIQVQAVAGDSRVSDDPPAKLGMDLFSAFSLLFERAQSADTDAVAEQRAFLLAPMNRWIGLLDFDGKYGGFFNRTQDGDQEQTLKAFLERGQQDATLKELPANSDPSKFGFRQISIGKLFREPRQNR